MRRRFNDTGVCVLDKHYMADVSTKLEAMVEEGAYFTINRPRQYGKTSIMHALYLVLNKRNDYLVIPISFEGIGEVVFENEATFSQNFIDDLADRLEDSHSVYADLLRKEIDSIYSFKGLARTIRKWAKFSEEKLVLIIDEVDKASNNQLFLAFLGTLRNKYLDAHKGMDFTFQSVILAGVHDIKSLKLKISPETSGTFNSPWNIAIDFKVDMSFSPPEIAYMLADYMKDRGAEMDIEAISEKIYYYSSGYPYLVSKICKVVDEEIAPERWSLSNIDEAFSYLIDEGYTTTLFDDMIKNLENNQDLYDLVFEISFNGKRLPFNILDPIINLGSLYGILVKGCVPSIIAFLNKRFTAICCRNKVALVIFMQANLLANFIWIMG